jgi:hypothetical protein
MRIFSKGLSLVQNRKTDKNQERHSEQRFFNQVDSPELVGIGCPDRDF